MLDDQQVAKIRHGQRIDLPVPPGQHKLFLKIAWCQSRSFTFDARSGEAVEFQCEPGGHRRPPWGRCWPIPTHTSS